MAITKTTQPKAEALIAVAVGYNECMYLPAQLASMVLPHLRMGKFEYNSNRNGKLYNFVLEVPQIHLIPEDEVAAMHVRYALTKAEADAEASSNS